MKRHLALMIACWLNDKRDSDRGNSKNIGSNFRTVNFKDEPCEGA
jgi:hypothetical protein